MLQHTCSLLTDNGHVDYVQSLLVHTGNLRRTFLEMVIMANEGGGKGRQSKIKQKKSLKSNKDVRWSQLLTN